MDQSLQDAAIGGVVCPARGGEWDFDDRSHQAEITGLDQSGCQLRRARVRSVDKEEGRPVHVFQQQTDGLQRGDKYLVTATQAE